MLKVYIRPDIQDIGLVQIGATVEVSTDSNFSNLAYTTGDDITNETIFHIPVELTPGRVYYVRGRLIHKQGLTDWFSNSFTAVAVEVNELNLYPTVPVKLKAPELQLEVPGSEQPIENFKVRSLFQSPSGNDVISTSWIIEDIHGDAVFYLSNSGNNLFYLQVDFTLDKNKVYVIKCRHTLRSNDSTVFGSIPIYTTSSVEFTYLPDLIELNKGTNIANLFYKIPPYIDHIEFNVYNNWELALSGVSLVSSKNMIDLSAIIITSSNRLVVQARAVNIDGSRKSEWEYCTLDLSDNNVLLPHSLPKAL